MIISYSYRGFENRHRTIYLLFGFNDGSKNLSYCILYIRPKPDPNERADHEPLIFITRVHTDYDLIKIDSELLNHYDFVCQTSIL